MRSNILKNTDINKLAVMLIIMAGSILRLMFLTKEGLWYDEALTALSLKLPFFEMIKERLAAGHSPLYFMILYPIAKVFGNGEIAVRMPSVIASILSLYFFYKFSNEIFRNKSAVLVSLIFFTLSSLNIYFAQEARMYSMSVLFVILSYYALVISLNKESALYWIMYILASAVLLYMNASSAPIILAQAAYVLYNRKKVMIFSLSAAAAAALYLPMVLYYAGMKKLGFIEWLAPASLNTFLEFIYGFMFRPVPMPGAEGYIAVFYEVMKALSLTAALSLILFGAASLAYDIYKKNKDAAHDKDSVIMLILWMAVPLAFMWLYSELKQPMLGPKRYILTVAPAFYLFLGSAVGRIKWPKIRVGVFAALFALFFITLINFYHIPKREDWRGAIRHLDSRSRGGAVVYGDLSTQVMYKYYGRHSDMLILDIRSVYSGIFPESWILVRGREYGTAYKGIIDNVASHVSLKEAGGFESVRLFFIGQKAPGGGPPR